MDSSKWTLRMISLAFLFIASSSTELHIQQVTEGRGTSDNESYSLDANLGVTREFREARPSSKILTITNFSSVIEGIKSEVSYESSEFEASGYKWRLVVYLNGNYRDGTIGRYVSIYLKIIGAPRDRTEIFADLKFFVYNGKQRSLKYLTVTDGEVKRFAWYRDTQGISRLIPLSTFLNTSEGYLEQDSATFGAEIFIMNPAQVQEKVKYLLYPPHNVFNWKIHGYSKTNYSQMYYSDYFIVGDRYWRIGCYPKGSIGSRDSPSVFLYAGGHRPLALDTTTYAQFFLRVKNQRSHIHRQQFSTFWFPYDRTNIGAGSNNAIISLEDLNDASKGYLVNDTIILEAEIVRVSVTNIVSV